MPREGLFTRQEPGVSIMSEDESHYAPVQLGEEIPAADEYLELRRTCGALPRTREAARKGLAGGLFCITARTGGRLVGMGRVVGDGACFFQIADIMVHPDHRRRGLGSRIMERIMAYISATADASAHINLFSSPGIVGLYKSFGFVEASPVIVGMEIPRGKGGPRPTPELGAFSRVDLRVGRIVEAEAFPEATTPAYRLRIDFGALGVLRSSARITDLYDPASLPGRQVVCAVNLGERRIGPFVSQCLVLGVDRPGGADGADGAGVVLLQPEREVPEGTRVY